jgi:hypothetical protein
VIVANGQGGLEYDSGGGSGGSIWLTAGSLAGNGLFAANGGGGGFWQGGGGGGGRIALYARSNTFSVRFAAAGGPGYYAGQDGSIYLSSSLSAPEVVGQSPTGVVSNGVALVTLFFSEPVNPFSVSNVYFTLNTPTTNFVLQAGQGLVSVSTGNPAAAQFSFPLQTTPGDYAFTVGKQIQDLFGQPMSQAYSGSFTLSVPVVQGRVTTTNGVPIPGVVLTPSIGSPAVTDAMGSYVVGAASSSYGSFTITPNKNGLVFLPHHFTYNIVSTSISNANYLAVPTISPTLATQLQGTNLILSWYGLPWVTYTNFVSTDLATWTPYLGPIYGPGRMIQMVITNDGSPARFFRVLATEPSAIPHD